jgi:hypothetical protein
VADGAHRRLSIDGEIIFGSLTVFIPKLRNRKLSGDRRNGVADYLQHHIYDE